MPEMPAPTTSTSKCSLAISESSLPARHDCLIARRRLSRAKKCHVPLGGTAPAVGQRPGSRGSNAGRAPILGRASDPAAITVLALDLRVGHIVIGHCAGSVIDGADTIHGLTKDTDRIRRTAQDRGRERE